MHKTIQEWQGVYNIFFLRAEIELKIVIVILPE